MLWFVVYRVSPKIYILVYTLNNDKGISFPKLSYQTLKCVYVFGDTVYIEESVNFQLEISEK